MIGEILDRKYKLVRLRGEGGMGSVYEAEHTQTGRRVAIKIIHRDLVRADRAAVRRFSREARAASAAESPHIVQVLDAGEDPTLGVMYLVMEYLHGEDLQQLIDRRGPLDPDVALRIAAQALTGLQKAHEKLIVHRDIKPANVLLARSSDGAITVKLVDFGIAKLKSDPMQVPHTAGLTTSGHLIGSPLYMSPEQVLGSSDIDHRTDLWSLGSMLYCAVAGRAPHGHIDAVGRLLFSICSSPPPPLRETAPWVSPEFDEIVCGALQIDRERRWPNAAAMLDAMRTLLPEGMVLHERMLAQVGMSARTMAAPSVPASATALAPQHAARTMPATPASTGPPLLGTLPAYSENPRARLEPLDAERAAALCRALLLPAENVPNAVVERFVAQTHAVPVLLVELVQKLKRSGIVRPHANGGGFYVATDQIDRLLADEARSRHAYAEAELHYSRAIELATASSPAPGQVEAGATASLDTELLSLLRGRGLVRYRLGRHQDALADFTAARADAQRSADVEAEIEILLDEAQARDWMDDYATAAERVQQARALASGARSPRIEARLLLGEGLAEHRQSREEQAAALLERAAERAALIGEEAYETLIIALLLLGFILQTIGRVDDAGRSLDRAIALCDARGDALHLGAALNGRGLVRAVRGDKAGMIADLERVVALGRELRQAALELAGYFNLAEYLYLMDDLDAAMPYIERARAAAARQAGATPEVVRLLEARLRLYAGDEAAAHAIATGVRQQDDRARAEGAIDALLGPADDILCTMIELATRDATDAEWQALEARSAVSSVGQDRIEVLEARVLSLLRRGRLHDAARQLDKTLDLAARIPNVLHARLARRRAEVEARLRESGA